MSWSVLFASLWVLAGTVTALLPMRLQYAPGLTLLVLAPVVIVWLLIDFGWIWGLLALAAFVSMFRNPLKYFYARARGQKPEVPK